MPLPDPVVVVPGITANYLLDEYPLPPELIWTVLDLEYERAALHPDDLRYEAAEPALVRPGQLYEIAYKEMVNELRHNLTPTADQPVPVFPFAYDWRQPLELTEVQLDAFIKEVIARTSLLRHYVRDGYRRRATVTLVGHSMGGLIIAGYLQQFGAQGQVRKVATLAAPFRGSFEAVIKVTTGTANLGAAPPSSREREAARLTPALYYLIPDVPDGVEAAPGLPQSLFDPGLWQPSILQTLAEYIRLHGIDPNDLIGQATTLFQAMLGKAKAHRDRIDGFKLDQAGMVPSDWLCVIGVNSVTRVRLQVIRNPDSSPDFGFHSDDRQNRWTEGDPAVRIFTGDGTVPFEGAVPRFLALENLVCVTLDDFGYWEISDRVTTSLAGFHGIMPNMDMLHRLIVRHFTGAPDEHNNTWGRRAPGAAAWVPPLPLKEERD